MKLKALKKFETKGYELSKLTSLIKEFLDQLMDTEQIRGEKLEISVTTSGVSVNHGLGSTPNGWHLIDNTSNSTVWRSAWNDKTITLVSSVNTTVKVWVF